MSDASRGQIDTAAAEVYDEFFVPALFGQWAGPVADAAGIEPGDRVLDVACGTGVLARAAYARAAPGGSATGVDCNEGMLAVARRSERAIDWRHGRAEQLPFEQGVFDRVVSQFGLMFFENRPLSLSEMRRVLRPGGRCAVAVWASLDRTPGYADMTDLLARLFDDDVADALRAPYCLGDPETLTRLFREGGFGKVEVRTLPGRARYPSIDDWVRMDVKGWTLGQLIDDRGYERLRAAARAELGHHVGPDGSVSFDAPAHVVVADA